MQTFTYDETDRDVIASRKWSITGSGYVRATVPVDGERFLHRILLKPSGREEIDHIDGNPSNNKRTNLRIVTRSLNGFSRRMPKRDLPRGISYHRGKYQASIRVNKKLRYLGRFNSIADAQAAYERASIQNFGEVAPNSIVLA